MPQAQHPKILFVTYGGGHVAMVIPVVQRLLEQRLAEPIVMALTIAGAACRRAGIPYIGFKDFVDLEEGAAELGLELTAGASDHPDVDAAESVAYHGVSYLDLVRRFGPTGAAQRFETEGRAAFRPVSFFEQVIREVAPDLVVATNSPRSERAAIEAAGRLGVPSCCILDVFGYQEEWVMEPGFADRVCVIDESVREAALARGRVAAEVVVTGNPAFDELAAVRDQRALRPRSSSYCVLWASHPEPFFHPLDPTRLGNMELQGEIATELVDCALRHPEWEIIVRPHPSESALAVDGPPNLSVTSEDALEDHLTRADVVVTAASTVGLQAALVGIPVVAVRGSVISADFPLAESGLAYGVDVARLGELLEDLRHAPKSAKPELQELGTATGSVVDVLLSLC